MTYIDRVNDFNLWLESNSLAASSQLMYYKLLHVFNRAGWPKYVQVDNRRMMLMIDAVTEKAAIRARDRLVEAGLIGYERGKKGCPNRYFLKKHCPQDSISDSISDSINDSISDSISDSINDSHIKTKTKNKTKEKSPTETKRKNAFSDYAGEDANLLSALEDYAAMRQKIKKPMTERAKQQLCGKLDKLAGTAAGKVELLNEAILHCWQSVYVPDGWKEGTRGNADNAGADPGKAAKSYHLRSALDDLDGY